MGIARTASTKRRLMRPLQALAAALVLGAVGALLRRRTANGERSAKPDANKATSRRMFEEVFNAGEFDVLDELVTPAAIEHDSALPEPVTGPAQLKETIAGYRTAFPDLRIAVEEQVAEGDLVTTRWTARGTHQGDLMGVAPTGKQATVTGVTIDRYEDGRIAEAWTNWDTLGLLQQLGALPTVAQL